MTVNAAVVGVGYLGRFHAQKYAANPRADLKYVVDADPKRAAEVAAEVGAEPLSDYRELIGKVDAVSVSAPTSAHYQITHQLLEAGIDVLVEKPMSVTLEEADLMIAAAEKNDRILAVGLLERFNPAILACYDQLGTPMFIECHRLASFVDRGADVDVVLDLMIHDLDIIIDRVDSELVDVRSVGVGVITSSVDIANARLEFANGAVANVTASRVSVARMRKLRIFQPEMYLSIDLDACCAEIIRRRYNEDGSPSISGETLNPGKGDALAAEIENFLNAVETRGRPRVDGRAGRRAQAAAHSVLENMKKPGQADIERFSRKPE